MRHVIIKTRALQRFNLPTQHVRPFNSGRHWPTPIRPGSNVVPKLHAVPLIHGRGAKSKTTVKLGDLPQGILEGGPLPPTQEDEGPGYPAVVQQAWNHMQKFQDCVLLTRVGNFYELYLDHADKYGPLLNLKVANKPAKGLPIAMAGFPLVQLDRYLKILVQDMNERVAIAEEFPHSLSSKVKNGGTAYDRKVTRVITPGTLIDENFMDPYENNFLLAIHPLPLEAIEDSAGSLGEKSVEAAIPIVNHELQQQKIGLAWIDLSTGDFFTQATQLKDLPSEMAKVGAKEILLASEGLDDSHEGVLHLLGAHGHLATRHPPSHLNSKIEQWEPMLERPVPSQAVSAFTKEEVAAGGLVLSYVQEKLQGRGIKLQPPIRKDGSEIMGLDTNSLRTLEILKTAKDGISGGKGTMVHSLRRTVTKGGTRKLKEWIKSPSMSIEVINARLDIVSIFLQDLALREDVIQLLRQTYDSQRLVQKLSIGQGDADDLISLRKTIESTETLKRVLTRCIRQLQRDESLELQSKKGRSLQSLIDRISLAEPLKLAGTIADAIDEQGLYQLHLSEEAASEDSVNLPLDPLRDEDMPQQVPQIDAKNPKSSPKVAQDQVEPSEAWIMRRSASPNLENLHEKLDLLRAEIPALTEQLRDQYKVTSLTLRHRDGIGHYCHVKGIQDMRNLRSQDTDRRDIKSSKTTKTFHDTEWTRLGSRIERTKLSIRAEEQRILSILRDQVVENMMTLRRNAFVLDEIDIACAFAMIAREQGLVRPIISEKPIHRITGGRHLTVKQGLEEDGRAFISNDCSVGEKERIWFITGPNMGGKSTFLRQNALISILAQIGSYVPADHAEIGLVDHIFTRVGSADNLFKHQSTFMMEMLETAAILNQATSRSFVLVDELGRGTTPEAGIAVGFACLHHLHHHNKSRVLFATHFHTLADMSRDFDSLGCYCTNVVEEDDGSFSYLHRLEEGVNRESHALKVAQLAGMPDIAMTTARQVLRSFDLSSSKEHEERPPLKASAG